MGEIKNIFKPIENPLIKDNFSSRHKYWICRTQGHIEFGAYYGMRQATCSRCGKKLSGANEHVPDWRMPD